jgi:hypothetical protein
MMRRFFIKTLEQATASCEKAGSKKLYCFSLPLEASHTEEGELFW